jgi:hypothetical protein
VQRRWAGVRTVRLPGVSLTTKACTSEYADRVVTSECVHNVLRAAPGQGAGW